MSLKPALYKVEGYGYAVALMTDGTSGRERSHLYLDESLNLRFYYGPGEIRGLTSRMHRSRKLRGTVMRSLGGLRSRVADESGWALEGASVDG